MKITININDYFLVTLTDAGERAWAKHWHATHPSGVPDEVRSAAILDGRVRIQIWEAMRIFGPECYLGNSNGPFASGDIEIRGFLA